MLLGKQDSDENCEKPEACVKWDEKCDEKCDKPEVPVTAADLKFHDCDNGFCFYNPQSKYYRPDDKCYNGLVATRSLSCMKSLLE